MLAEVVTLCDRAIQNDARNGTAAELRGRFLAALEAATAKMRGPRGEEWTLASYALASLIDELMIVEIPWH